jgi:hypothetical protein
MALWSFSEPHREVRDAHLIKTLTTDLKAQITIKALKVGLRVQLNPLSAEQGEAAHALTHERLAHPLTAPRLTHQHTPNMPPLTLSVPLSLISAKVRYKTPPFITPTEVIRALVNAI